MHRASSSGDDSACRTHRRAQHRHSAWLPGYTGRGACQEQLAVHTWRCRLRPNKVFVSAWLLLLLMCAAAHVSAEPALAAAGSGTPSAAEHDNNTVSAPTTGKGLTQPVVDDPDYSRPEVPTAASAILPPEHSISKVVSCLGQVNGQITPANTTAYEVEEEVARLLPLKLWQSTKQPPQRDLTIFTTMTKDRLDMLDAQCASWPGPLAAVVYVPVVEKAQLVKGPGEFTEDQLEAIQAVKAAVQGAFDRAEAVPKSCVLTLLLSYEYVQPSMRNQLPINSMRNHALLLAQTPLVALLGADLMASASMAQALADAEQLKDLRNRLQGQQHFMVLPAYEPLPIKERVVDGMSGAAMAVIFRQQQKVAAFAAGSNKETLERLVNEQMLQPFDGKASPFGHKETDFVRWLACKQQRCPVYEFKPESDRFEPWGVLDRQQALQHAPYDEVYRGYGKNKISNIWWMRQQGFKLFVHGTAFIVHRSHAISSAKWCWRKEYRSRLPINTQKFNRAVKAMKANTYAPKLHNSTAACIQQELVRISRREE